MPTASSNAVGYSPEHIAEKLAPHLPARAVALDRPAMTAVAQHDTGIPAAFDLISAPGACSFAADFARTGGRTEPEWRAALGLVKHCDGGEKLAHDFSAKSTEYEPSETQGKFDRWGVGPPTCAHISDIHRGCKECPHRGKITSPIQLGRAPVAPPWVKELNERFAVVRWGSSVVILDGRTPSDGPDGTRYGRGFLDLAAFRALHRGQAVPGNEGKPLAEAWLAHPQRRQYDGAVFAPPPVTPPPANILNLWEGFAYEPKAMCAFVALWLELLARAIPDPQVRQFVHRWIAWKVQNPGAVPGTVLVCIGLKGTGKNSLLEPIVRIFGRHGAVFDDPEQVAGRFTGHLMTTAFAVLDEALFSGDPRQADRIKARSTATSMTYEAKGKDPISGQNRCAYVLLTNHAHAWQATTDERRAVVVNFAQELKSDKDFWARYQAALKDGGPAELLAHLLGLDLTGFDVRAIPKSSGLQEQVARTSLRSAPAAWWAECLTDGEVHDGVRMHELHVDVPTELAAEAAKASFTRYCQRSGLRCEWHVAAREFLKWGWGLQVRRGKDRHRVYPLPPLSTLRDAFTAATGVTFSEAAP